MPMRRGGRWWRQEPDGSWEVWDEVAAAWRASPPPPFDQAEDADLALGWFRGKRAIAVLVAVALVAVGGGVATLIAVGRVPDAGTASVDGRLSPALEPAATPLSELVSPTSCLRPEDVAPLERPRPETLRAEVLAIASLVAEVRQLRFERRVDASFLRPKPMKRRVRALFFEDYPRRRALLDQRLLETLGAIPAGTDLIETLDRLVTTQVGGFYVPETKELVVASNPRRELSPFAEVILSHELEHALADQALGLPTPEESSPRRADIELAAHALVEGDATLAMQLYAVRALSLSDQIGLGSDPAVARATAALPDLPHYVRRSFEFPYAEGLLFVCDLYSRGGWRAVNRAYQRPPGSTAQILFPQWYEQGETPEPVRGADAVGSGWERRITYGFGAADLLWLFEAPGNEPDRALDDIAARVSGWDGGLVQLWTKGAETAVGLYVAQREGAPSLCDSLADWYRASFPDATEHGADALTRFSGDSEAVLNCTGREVRIGIAPDVTTADALVR